MANVTMAEAKHWLKTGGGGAETRASRFLQKLADGDVSIPGAAKPAKKKTRKKTFFGGGEKHEENEGDD